MESQTGTIAVSPTPEQLMLIGGLCLAKEQVQWAKAKIKPAKKMVGSAIKDDKTFGMFEDCGSYYQEELALKKAKLAQTVEMKKSLEKFYKLKMHEYFQKFLQGLAALQQYAVHLVPGKKKTSD